MFIKSKVPVKRHLQQMFETAISMPARKRTLRASGLPYCSILDAITERPKEESADLPSTFYTSIGTKVHSIIQFFLAQAPMGKNMYGRWKCASCGEISEPGFKPIEACRHCRSNEAAYTYEEMTFQVGPLSGHLDFLARYNGKWVALEFKTTGLLANGGLPKTMHYIQIRTYIALLWICYKIKVDSYAIVYFSRLNPKQYQVYGPYDAHKNHNSRIDRVFQTIKAYKTATKYRKEPISDHLKEVVQNRPCKTMDDWDEYMATAEYRFEGQPCPLLPYCTKSSKSIFQHLNEVLNVQLAGSP